MVNTLITERKANAIVNVISRYFDKKIDRQSWINYICLNDNLSLSISDDSLSADERNVVAIVRKEIARIIG